MCSGVLKLDRAIAAVELTNSQYWRVANPSYTFHGRDIFASVGAHLASGVPLKQLGTTINIDSIVKLDLPSLKVDRDIITGCIQYIDRFGNLITNIDNSVVAEKSWQIIVKDLVINVGKTYSDVPQAKAVALTGSHGWIEIAVNGGNAASELQLTWKDPVKVKLNS